MKHLICACCSCIKPPMNHDKPFELSTQIKRQYVNPNNTILCMTLKVLQYYCQSFDQTTHRPCTEFINLPIPPCWNRQPTSILYQPLREPSLHPTARSNYATRCCRPSRRRMGARSLSTSASFQPASTRPREQKKKKKKKKPGRRWGAGRVELSLRALCVRTVNISGGWWAEGGGGALSWRPRGGRARASSATGALYSGATKITLRDRPWLFGIYSFLFVASSSEDNVAFLFFPAALFPGFRGRASFNLDCWAASAGWCDLYVVAR